MSTSDAGYRALPPNGACARCRAPIEARSAVLSGDGPICARCAAMGEIAAAQGRVDAANADPPTLTLLSRLADWLVAPFRWSADVFARMPFFGAKTAFALGVLILLGGPISLIGFLDDWFGLATIFWGYAIAVPMALLSALHAFVRSARVIQARPPPDAPMAEVPGATVEGSVDEGALAAARAHRAAVAEASDQRALAATGTGLAAMGCGSVALAGAIAAALALVLLVVVASFVIPGAIAFFKAWLGIRS